MNPSKVESTQQNEDLYNSREDFLQYLKDRKGEGYWTVRRML